MPPQPAPRRRPRIPIGLILFGIIVIGGAVYGWYQNAGRSTSGEINKAGELQVSDLRVGDCFDLAEPDASQVEKVSAKPCTSAHAYELFYLEAMPAGDYPTDAAFQSFVETRCGPAFATYVGIEYEASALDVAWFFPSSDGWSQDDRTIQCALYDPGSDQLQGSLKGSKR